MEGIAIEIAFQKKIVTGLFGGEGFIMQKLVGDGLAFMHAGGTVISKDLSQGEMLKLDTGCLVANWVFWYLVMFVFKFAFYFRT